MVSSDKLRNDECYAHEKLFLVLKFHKLREKQCSRL